MANTKTVIGSEGLKHPTPVWATWLFRVEFVLNKVALYVLGSTSLVSPDNVKESLIWIAALDMLIWGLARFIGEKKESYEEV